MVAPDGRDQIVPVANLMDYFRTSVEDVMATQGVTVKPHATYYVVNLLTHFSRSEDLYDPNEEAVGVKPLALMMADANDASSAEERSALLRRLGDVALFISGFFSDMLATRMVDLDYYINMGGSAYGSLSSEVRGTFHGKAFAETYTELADKFHLLVDVLNEVRDRERPDSDVDVLRTYDIWRKTGSMRAEKLLRNQGVIPVYCGGTSRH